MSDISTIRKDSKGRTVVQDMSDRELLEECTATLRAFGDALEQVSSNPMLRAMMPKVSF